MPYKLIILAPSCGGKSSLMRFLRSQTDLQIAESDEAVTEANGGKFPEDTLKNEILIPQTTEEIIRRENIVYLASYIPTELLLKAKDIGFRIILLDIPKEVLLDRNRKRMYEEKYDDVSQWFDMQLANLSELERRGVIDQKIDGNTPIERVAQEITRAALSNRKEA